MTEDEQDRKPTLKLVDGGLTEVYDEGGILVWFEGALAPVPADQVEIILDLTISIHSEITSALLLEQTIKHLTFQLARLDQSPTQTVIAPVEPTQFAFPIAPDKVDHTFVQVALSDPAQGRVLMSPPLLFTPDGMIRFPTFELDVPSAVLGWRPAARSRPTGEGHLPRPELAVTLDQVGYRIKARIKLAEAEEKLGVSRRKASRNKPGHKLTRRPHARPTAHDWKKPPPPGLTDTLAQTGTILAVPDWTQLGFAALSIPTSGPIIDCVPALDDAVWAERDFDKETQTVRFLNKLCMIREASLKPDWEQYCPQEGSLMGQLADSIERRPTSQQREYFNDACLFGYLGRKSAAVIDKAVFELKDPARVRRDYSALLELLDTLPAKQARLVRQRMARSDPIEDLVIQGTDVATTLELGSTEIERLRIFERVTGSSAYQVFTQAQLGPAALFAPFQPDRSPSAVPCKLCGAFECGVHFAQDEPSPNVPTAIHGARGPALPPPSPSSTPSFEAWDGEVAIPSTQAYVPCSHEGRACEGPECSCVGSKVWCDKFCGCPPECERRFKGCDCADRGRRGCGEHTACQCYKTNRECDPALCAKHGPSEGWIKEGQFCGNNHISIGRVEPTEVGSSTLPGAGLGLFAVGDVKAGDLLGAYGGEHYELESGYGALTDLRCQFLKASYEFTDNRSHAMTTATLGNQVRFINTKDLDPSGKSYNCTPRARRVQGITQMGVYATGAITAGDELFMCYGDDYPRPWGRNWRKKDRARRREEGDEVDSDAEERAAARAAQAARWDQSDSEDGGESDDEVDESEQDEEDGVEIRGGRGARSEPSARSRDWLDEDDEDEGEGARGKPVAAERVLPGRAAKTVAGKRVAAYGPYHTPRGGLR